jgi:signal transduction histidine kinase/CheY-like chemotaxis protein
LDAIITVNKDDRILEYNPAAERLLPGITLTMSLPEVLSPYLSSETYRQLSSSPTTITIANPATGNPAYLDVIRLQAPIDGGVLDTIFIRDVTEARASEAALRRAAEVAQAADEAKTDFLAKFSHELRTPLHAVHGMADIAIHAGATGDVRECLERIQINTLALTSLINDILDTSKIETGEFDLDDRPLDIWDLIDQAGESLSFKATQKGLDFFWTVDKAVPIRIRGDMQRLRQIIVNLLSNAIKFTEQGYVQLFVWKEEHTLFFQVEDSGIGITSDDIEKVGKQKYWRSARTQKYPGTGLGMTITQSLVHQMGGAMEVRSTVGLGSTFRVTLPLNPIPNAIPPIQPHAIWVLLEHDLTRTHVVQILTTAGYPVVEVSGDPPAGNPALFICETSSLPGRRLASVLQPRGCKILAITALGRRPEGQEDMDAYLIRPFGSKRLLDTVVRLLEPTQTPAADPYSQKSGDNIVRHRQRVLVVEDNPDNQLLAVHALGKAGYDVRCADNGLLGHLAAAKEDFALILMDIEMPEMDGFQAATRIRSLEEQEGRPRTPIIALTAHAVEGYRQSCLDAGMDEYVTKPIQRKRLVELVAAWVDPRPTALIVDDSMDNREILRRFLERDRRIRPVCVSDGDAALRLVRRRPFDVVIVDKEMPRMDGMELLQKLLELDPTTRCIVLTGHTSTETRRKVLDAGALRFVSKPIERSLFIDTVLQVLALPFQASPENL